MLSSTPSLLLPGLAPLTIAGEAVAPAAAKAASGFADLLNGLAAKAAETISGEDGAQEGTEQAPAVDAAPLAKEKATAPRAGRRQAVEAKAANAEVQDVPAAQPAAPALAAIESGKILPVALPVALPEAAASDDAVPTAPPAVETPVTPVALPGAPTVQTAVAEPAPAPAPAPAATPSGRPTTVAAKALAHKVNATPGQPADKTKPAAQSPEARPTPAVAITVAVPSQPAVAETADALAKQSAPVRTKPTRAADLVRVELPQVSTPAPAATPFAAAEQTVQPVAAPVAIVRAAMPSPHDIDAALDHLVAAREALMPAEAALAIDHAEFGEVSIKFEQSSDGRLSAELTAADPDLKRAVTAAVASDRAPTTSEGDNRSAQLTNQRGSSPTGGETAGGGRGQSGAQSGAERELPQRRAHSQTRHAATDQRPGIFA